MPYAEKDEAKRLGARWDPKARTWYVPPGLPRAPFARWLLRRLPGGPALFGSTNPVFYKVLAVRIGHHRDCGALVETRRHFGNLDCDLIPYRWAFLSFDTVADAVAQLIPQDQLTRHGGGAAEAQEQQDGAEQLRQQRVPEVRRVDREPPARAGTARRRETLRPLPDHRAQPA